MMSESRADRSDLTEMGGATWEITQRPGGPVVAVAGEFDLAAEQRWLTEMDRLFGEVDHSVTIDLSAVDFMDSSGVRALLVLRNRYGERFVVDAMSDPVQQLLDITGVRQILSPSISERDDEVGL
jgi:anti-sigma B factor antagonist